MSISGSGLRPSTSNLSKDDFPILCETCLGDNPLVRMQCITAAHNPACKICDRPYVGYRWKAGTKGRYKKTEICTLCARLRNCCQTCILDLQYGLPTQVRDSVLQQLSQTNGGETQQAIALPESRVQKAVAVEGYETQLARAAERNPDAANESLYAPIQQSAVLDKLSRHNSTAPYYKRNEAKLCSFFARGECNRGSACPFRHEKPSDVHKDESLKKQNLKDRYYGRSDPVALKIIDRLNTNSNNSDSQSHALPPPADQSLTTLWLGGIDATTPEVDVFNKFEQYGQIQAINMYVDRSFAFVEYGSRSGAEEAVKRMGSLVDINGKQVTLKWAKPKQSKTQQPPALPVYHQQNADQRQAAATSTAPQ